MMTHVVENRAFHRTLCRAYIQKLWDLNTVVSEWLDISGSLMSSWSDISVCQVLFCVWEVNGIDIHHQFFVPDYISEVRWIEDEIQGLLSFPFNSTLGGTAASPPYFNNKDQASEEQYLKNIETCTFLIEMQLSRPYQYRGSDLSTWEAIAVLPYLDRELSPAKYRSFFIPYMWQEKNVFRKYVILRRVPK